MVVAEMSIFPLGTGTTSVSDYVAAAVKAIEGSGLKCTLGAMGTTIEAETPEEAYAAVARAHAAVFELGAGRAYAVVKVDDRRDAEPRSGEERLRSTREKLNAG